MEIKRLKFEQDFIMQSSEVLSCSNNNFLLLLAQATMLLLFMDNTCMINIVPISYRVFGLRYINEKHHPY